MHENDEERPVTVCRGGGASREDILQENIFEIKVFSTRKFQEWNQINQIVCM